MTPGFLPSIQTIDPRAAVAQTMTNTRSRHKCKGVNDGVNTDSVGVAHPPADDGISCMPGNHGSSDRGQRWAQKSSGSQFADRASVAPLSTDSTSSGRQMQVRPGYPGNHVRSSRIGDEAAFKPSKLDFFDPQSDLARSDYRGIAVLLCRFIQTRML